MKQWILAFVICCFSVSAFSGPLPESEIEDVVWRLRRGLQIDLYQRPTPQGPQVVALTKVPIVWMTTEPTQILLHKLQTLLATQNNQIDPAYKIYQWESMYPKRLTLFSLGLALLDYAAIGSVAYQMFVNHDPAAAERYLFYNLLFLQARMLSYWGGALFNRFEDQAGFKIPFFYYYVNNTLYLKTGTQTLEEIFKKAKQPGGLILLAAISSHYKRLPVYLEKMGFKKWEPEKG